MARGHLSITTCRPPETCSWDAAAIVVAIGFSKIALFDTSLDESVAAGGERAVRQTCGGLEVECIAVVAQLAGLDDAVAAQGRLSGVGACRVPGALARGVAGAGDVRLCRLGRARRSSGGWICRGFRSCRVEAGLLLGEAGSHQGYENNDPETKQAHGGHRFCEWAGYSCSKQ